MKWQWLPAAMAAPHHEVNASYARDLVAREVTMMKRTRATEFAAASRGFVAASRVVAIIIFVRQKLEAPTAVKSVKNNA